MIVRADARHIPLADGSVQCVISSPPYWGLRDYGTARWDGGDADCDHKTGRFERGGLSAKQSSNNGSAGDEAREVCGKCGARRIDAQIGLEPTPEAYVATMVQVFREVWRVLRDDGTLWLNLGDSYSSGQRTTTTLQTVRNGNGDPSLMRRPPVTDSVKPKDLIGIPWRVAFALQADGWYLRSDIIWAKPNPMPESVTDRPTRSHEYLFLLSKSERYFYDADAIREDLARDYSLEAWANVRGKQGNKENSGVFRHNGNKTWAECMTNGRNKRDVWTINSEPTPEAHFATFPQKLIEPCILAGTSEKGCCAECGAPRVRVVERTKYEPPAASNGERFVDASRGDKTRKLNGADYNRQVQTLGESWQPSCAHDAPGVPCVVFDPFLGSGTVGKVCERLGRRWIGLELSPDYIDIARKRTAQAGLIFLPAPAELAPMDADESSDANS